MKKIKTMGKYIKYKRFEGVYNTKMLQDKLDSLIKEGLDIIHYYEKKQDNDKFYVVMICGKINIGNKKEIL